MKEPERPMRQEGRTADDLARDHLMRARYYAEIASIVRAPDSFTPWQEMALMHYLGFLAETQWSKNPHSDQEESS